VPRPRKDLETHSLHGTRPAYSEPASDVRAGRPKYPKNLSLDAKATFKRLVKLLETRRTCTQGDAEILRLYCVAFDRHTRALEHLAAEGEICVYVRLDSNGQPHDQEKPNLWLAVAENCEKYMRACLSDLGLNPINRAKVKPAEEKKPEPLPNVEEPWPAIASEPDIELPDETVVN